VEDGVQGAGKIQWSRDIPVQKSEALAAVEPFQVRCRTSGEIVDGNDVPSSAQEGMAQM
jgi:hypothetical protein